MNPLNLHDFEALAKERLPAMAFDYFAGGAGDEVTLRGNRAALERIALRPRVLVDVSKRSMTCDVLGNDTAMPLLVAPMAFQRLAHEEGEIATARAVRAAKSVMILSCLATSKIEDVVAAAKPARVWFQLYVLKDRGATKAIVQRAEAAGCMALVVTVDAPYLGRRERDARNGFCLPEGVRAVNFENFGKDVVPTAEGSGLASYFGSHVDTTFNWSDLAWLRGITRMSIVVKGVLRADDAREITNTGCAGIVVSNHGGRQLDGAVAAIDALPQVVAAVGGKVQVFVDGGFRRGADVVKALALGARAVLLGRPVLWGLAVDGEAGVRRVLELMSEEIDLAMALCGCRSVEEIRRDLVV